MVRVRHCIAKDVRLILVRFIGVAKFHEVIRPDEHARSVVLVPPVYKLVDSATLHDIGFESLESGFPVHVEMSWMIQRKEGRKGL